VKYRPEIDGLRTIAVMSVMLSHAGFSWFSGGYVGVDVFFVISGFLITHIIVDGQDKGVFSVLNFYERRARRILPALLIVIFACLIAGWFFMGPDSYRSLGEHVVATVLSANNVLLMRTIGYWDMEASFKPLLHTWSLGVEEQYYAIVPFVMIAMHRLASRSVTVAMAIIAAISLSAAIIGAIYFPDQNFYLLPTRAWELAAGALITLTTRHRQAPPSSPLLAATGLILILGAAVGFPAALPSPSAFTIIPVLGASLVITFCRGGPVYRLLASRPMVGIGLISYSAYLWHQPLFVFLRVIDPKRPAPWMFGLMILITLGVAYLSWRFVEVPIRDRAKVPLRTLLLGLVPSALVLTAAGAVIAHEGGLPRRLPMPPNSPAPGSYKTYNSRIFQYKAASFPQDHKPNLLVLGNSTARDFVNMAIENGKFKDYNIVYRDDFLLCDWAKSDETLRRLVISATLVVSVYDHRYIPTCDAHTMSRWPQLFGKVVFVGSKDFGVNLNPDAFIPLIARRGVKVQVSDEALEADRRYRALTPPSLYVSILQHLSTDGRSVPVFDESGRMLSEDRVHLTQPGARFVGARIFQDPIWSMVERSAEARSTR